MSHQAPPVSNSSAARIFGATAAGITAAELFETGGAWWDIAPLESARRLLDRGEHRYLASVRRERVAESIGELSIVHLRERESVTPPA